VVNGVTNLVHSLSCLISYFFIFFSFLALLCILLYFLLLFCLIFRVGVFFPFVGFVRGIEGTMGGGYVLNSAWAQVLDKRILCIRL